MPKLILLFCFVATSCFAQGIRGKITTDKNEPLPFASIIVKNSQIGTMANQDGNYELKLPPGNHEIIFQFLGYVSQTKSVKIGEGTNVLNVNLTEQVLSLGEVKVQSSNEDPANTIMRKAIATAPIHLKEYDNYSVRVYLKGSGRLTDIPFLLEKTLKKDGIEENISYLTETVLDLKFSQPNKIIKKIIATRTNAGDSPQAQTFVGVSFYNSNFGGFISPLSSKAFSYYKFEYLGTTTDRGYQISRIRIKPRSRGDDVFEGIISIVENNWSIHSLDLKGMKEGINFRLKQVYAPIQDVFMPVTDQLSIAGGMLGFKGAYSYNISYNNYKLKVNESYHRQIEIIDEKISKQKAEKLQIVREDGKINLQKTFAENQELNRKQLKKVLKQKNKEDIRESPDKNQVIREDSVLFEPQYTKKSFSFWDTLRSVPLTEIEIKSTIRLDSINIAQAVKTKKDSVKQNTNQFSPMHLIFGHGYNFGKKDSIFIKTKAYGFQPVRLYFSGIDVQFNAVEAYKIGTSPKIQYNFSAFQNIYLKSNFMWSSGLPSLNGLRRMEFGLKQKDTDKNDVWEIAFSGGKDVFQFNPTGVSVFVNSSLSMYGQNNIRLYQKQFLNVGIEKHFSDKFETHLFIERSTRSSLTNTVHRSPFRFIANDFESNIPKNINYQDWQKHDMFSGNVGFVWLPFLKYRTNNGEKRPIKNSSPEIGLDAFWGNSKTNSFLRTEFTFSHEIQNILKGDLVYHVVGGIAHKSPIYFIDYKHFNRYIFLEQDLTKSYRLFDHYRYSTNKEYLSAFVNYDFRKFALSRIPQVRLLGIKEKIIANCLIGPAVNYFEFGYGVDNIFRLFKFEILNSFANGKHETWGFRVGMTGRLSFEKNKE